MVLKLRSLSVTCLLIGSSSAFARGGAWGWVNQQLLDRIQVSGNRQLGFHSHQVDGDRQTFNSLTYFGQGDRRFTDTGNISIVGNRVLNLFNFQLNFSDNRYNDPEAQRFSLNYRKSGWGVDAGDIQGSLLNANPLASFSRQLRGVSVEYRKGRFASKALQTQTRATPRTISFTGNNSPGPYYVQNGRLVSGSEQVQLDGRDLSINSDYVIDYEAGSITFLTGPISPTSTVVVTYESFDFNSARGTIQGIESAYDFGRFGQIGVTLLQQNTGASGGLSSRLQQFEGFGAPSTPYFLDFVPLNSAQFPTVIRVDGIRQTEGVDYFFDANNPAVFYFRRFIPSTSLVEVVYFPRPTSVAEGDRETVGINYRLPVGRASSIQYSQATGRLKSATPTSGTARILSGNFKSGGLNVRTSLRDVPDGYVTIESTGFSRNERALTLDADLNRGGYRYELSHRNGDVKTRRVDDQGQISFFPSSERRTRAAVNYTRERDTWSLEARRDESRRTGYDAQLDTITFAQSRRWGQAPRREGAAGAARFETRLSVDRQGGRFFSGETRHLERLGLAYEMRYRWTPEWSLGFKSSFSQIRFDGQTGSGRDVTLDASYVLSDRAAFRFDYLDGRSGSLSALSGYEGFGVGFDGNGFSSGLGVSQLAGGADVRRLRLGGTYRFSSKWALEGGIEQLETSGNFSTNTRSNLARVGVDWDMSRGHALNLNLSQSSTRYVGTGLNTQSTFLDAAFQANPAGPWRYRLSGSALLTGGGEFSQDSLYGEGSLAYRLNRRSSVGGRASFGRTSGYLPQEESLGSVFYEYRFFENLALVASYKIRRLTNLDPLASGSNGYRSRGFDLELSVSF